MIDLTDPQVTPNPLIRIIMELRNQVYSLAADGENNTEIRYLYSQVNDDLIKAVSKLFEIKNVMARIQGETGDKTGG